MALAKTKTITSSRYTKLIKDIRQLLTEARARIQEAASRELVQAYWLIGERIFKEGLTEQAGYREALLSDLGQELGIDASTLRRCVYFYQTYATMPQEPHLKWSHYKVLLPLSNPEERAWYEALVKEKGLTHQQLMKTVKQGRYQQLHSARGKLLASNKLKRPTQASFVYKGKVAHVVDGDTIILSLDLGFQVWKEQRIRLAEIDTPSLDEPKGQEAYKYVLEQLAKAQTVVVKTNKIDIYGRYVGYVFYSFRDEGIDQVFEEGRFLNQELVAKGLCSVY